LTPGQPEKYDKKKPNTVYMKRKLKLDRGKARYKVIAIYRVNNRFQN